MARLTPSDLAVPGVVPTTLDPNATTKRTPTSTLGTRTVANTNPTPDLFTPTLTPPDDPALPAFNPGPTISPPPPTTATSKPDLNATTFFRPEDRVTNDSFANPTLNNDTPADPAAPPPIDPTNPVGAPPTFDFPSTVAFNPIDPENNLRGQNILPGQDPRLSSAGDRTNRASEFSESALGRLEGPDRGQIAQDVLRQLRESSQDSFDKGVRDIGRSASRFGRLGSGVTTTRLGDLASNRETDLARAAQALSSDAAARTLDDRTSIFRSSLDAQRGFGDREGQLDRFGRLDRNEFRTERANEDYLSQLALNNRVRQTTLQDDMLNSSFNRDSRRLDQMSSAGFGGLPTGAVQSAADRYSNRADTQGMTASQLAYYAALQQGQ